MPRHRLARPARRRWPTTALVGLAVLAVPSAAGAVPGGRPGGLSAEPGRVTIASAPLLAERLGRSFAAGSAAQAAPTDALRAQELACFTDPTGDVVGGSGATTTGPTAARADVTGFCGEHTATITLTTTVAAPTDPAADPAWAGTTGVAWGLDTNGDGMEEFAVFYGRDAQGAVAVEVARSFDGALLCAGTPSYDETGPRTYTATFPSECIGSPARFLLTTAMAYDTGSEVLLDDTSPQGPVAAGPGAPAPSSIRRVDRLAGGDRYATAVAISRKAFPDGAPEVYLASGTSFPDALAGSSLSQGPVLLVPPCGEVPAVVLAEIRRLDPLQVYVLGGPQAVCDAVLEAARTA